MSGSRGDLHKARLSREGIRREKHEQSAAQAPRDAAPPFVNPHPYAMERSMREMHAPMAGLQLRSLEEAEARGRVPAC